jgi:hypothetical protein
VTTPSSWSLLRHRPRSIPKLGGEGRAHRQKKGGRHPLHDRPHFAVTRPGNGLATSVKRRWVCAVELRRRKKKPPAPPERRHGRFPETDSLHVLSVFTLSADPGCCNRLRQRHPATCGGMISAKARLGRAGRPKGGKRRVRPGRSSAPSVRSQVRQGSLGTQGTVSRVNCKRREILSGQSAKKPIARSQGRSRYRPVKPSRHNVCPVLCYPVRSHRSALRCVGDALPGKRVELAAKIF